MLYDGQPLGFDGPPVLISDCICDKFDLAELLSREPAPQLPARQGQRLCWRHQDALVNLVNPDNLGEPARDIPASIPVLFAMLDPIAGGDGTDERRAPGFRSTPAANLNDLAMRDDRSRNDPQMEVQCGVTSLTN